MKVSPMQRTMRVLRDMGLPYGIVERYIASIGQRADLFGIIDLIALDPQRGVVGIQVCGQSFAAHKRKILIERREQTHQWLTTPGAKLEIWGWRKLRNKGRGGRPWVWEPRILEITLDMLEDEPAPTVEREISHLIEDALEG